jgi:hypothetical protein
MNVSNNTITIAIIGLAAYAIRAVVAISKENTALAKENSVLVKEHLVLAKENALLATALNHPENKD